MYLLNINGKKLHDLARTFNGLKNFLDFLLAAFTMDIDLQNPCLYTHTKKRDY